MFLFNIVVQRGLHGREPTLSVDIQAHSELTKTELFLFSGDFTLMKKKQLWILYSIYVTFCKQSLLIHTYQTFKGIVKMHSSFTIINGSISLGKNIKRVPSRGQTHRVLDQFYFINSLVFRPTNWSNNIISSCSRQPVINQSNRRETKLALAASRWAQSSTQH